MEKILTKEELEKATNSMENLVLKFSAGWCQPCALLSSLINDIAGDFNNVNFIECDVDEVEEDLINEHNVRNIPVLVFFKNGFQVDKTVGMIGREKLIEKLNEHYGKL